ncbi:MAG: 4-hydroxythreonine-4-phosphate dehydrogenase PdxA [Ilumatobacteraceae bacterium]|nr:4-hydroxythreonine-4-phosphate dehydrogenase PdxA [Ilumatobacteraceae bacterium]
MSRMSTRPIIAVTMGDPAGVGPEVVVKALARADVLASCRPVVIGDSVRLAAAAELCGVTLDRSAVDIVDVGTVPADLPWGRVSPLGGDAAYRYIERAAAMALAGEVQAICTAPLNKEALHAAGHLFPGHTELLAHLTGTAEVSMMLVAPGLRVVHVTTHIGIIDAIAKIEPGLVARTIRRADETLRRSGIARPRLAVCGINPHAGENGLFGHGEEAVKIEPAIATVRAEGIDAVGPLPADTLFFRARRGDFDCVVAMYHDQGHGPVKVLGLEAGVNITIGLPVVRTSVDHGTAFDIAVTGTADERSMVEALRQAVDLAAVAVTGR